MTSLTTIILAGGKGKRMNSKTPKVLHHLGGYPLLDHALYAAQAMNSDRITVVVSPEMAALETAHSTVVQPYPRGTGDAVRSVGKISGPVLILYGDTPFLTQETLTRMLQNYLSRSLKVITLGIHPDSPQGYGRLIMRREGLEKIVQERDATPEEREAPCHGGVMLCDGESLFRWLESLEPRPDTGEVYLTDIIPLARDQGCGVITTDIRGEGWGINCRRDLASLAPLFQDYLRDKALNNGATLYDPKTISLSLDTRIETDVTIEPYVYLGPKVILNQGAHIRSFCHLERVTVGQEAIIGPFARVRGSTTLSPKTEIGNFVEIKNSTLGTKTKAHHFCYLGDALIGERVNISAGVVTCNFDGERKSPTTVDSDAFIGANSSLIAPIAIGSGAMIGASTVLSSDVHPETLALTRPPLIVKPRKKKQSRA